MAFSQNVTEWRTINTMQICRAIPHSVIDETHNLLHNFSLLFIRCRLLFAALAEHHPHTRTTTGLVI